MAHDLAQHRDSEGKLKASFASTFVNGNEKAWHGLGTYFPEPMTVEQALNAGGLNYRVELESLTRGENNTVVSSHVATVRTDTNQQLGIVGKDYSVIQNVDAFAFFDELHDMETRIETAGALGVGERIFITAKLPHKITVGKDDLVDMYALLFNGHNGLYGTTVMLTPIRVVCQNTLSAALRGTKNRMTIKHTKNNADRIRQAGELMRTALSYQVSMEQAYNLLYNKKVSDSVAKDLIKQIIQQDKTDSTRMTNILDKIETSYFTGVGQENILGTAWGVFNAITHYNSHEKRYQSEETKFNSVIAGESSKESQSALELLLKF